MKPIELEVKGFQSFREKQIIDFETLTSKGLFGIFGPTGSGKSTILDAIMFALYGRVSREQQNEYINLNEKEAFVRYTFELRSGSQKRRFKVFRSNRKNSKTNKYGTANVVLTEINLLDGEEEVLAEKVREVNEYIENLIGLKMDDFTRAVVLPQGKFSEFLKIEPSKRNEMLERIFGLEKYGKVMTDKLKEEGKQNKSQVELKEELVGRYEDVSKENVAQLTEEVETVTTELQQKEKEQKQLQQQLDEAKEIREIQLELEINKQQQATLLVQQPKMKEREHHIAIAKQAAMVIPEMDELNAKQKKLAETKQALEQNKETAKQLTSQFENQKRMLEQIRVEKEKRTPYLVEQRLKLTEAIEQEEQKKQLEKQLQELRTKLKNERLQLQQINHRLTETKTEKETAEEELAKKKTYLETLQVNHHFRQEVAYAVDLEKRIESAEELSRELQKEITDKSQTERRLNEQLAQALAYQQKITEEITEIEGQLTFWKSKIIWTDEDFHAKQQQIFTHQTNLSMLMKVNEALKKKESEVKANEQQKAVINDELMLLHDKRGQLETKYNEVNYRLEEEKIQNLASIIASNLQQDEPCPVCGNIHKEKLAVANDPELLKKLGKAEKEIKQQLEEVKNTITQMTIQLSSFQQLDEKLLMEQKDLESQIGNMSEVSLKDEIEKLQQQYAEALKEKKEVELKVQKYITLQQEKNKEKALVATQIAERTATKTSLETQLMDLNKRREKELQQTQTAEAQLLPLRETYNISLFSFALAEIHQKDEKREKIERECQQIEIQLRNLTLLMEQLTSEQYSHERTADEIEQNGKQLKKEFDDLAGKIEKVCGNKEAKTFLQEVLFELQTLENNVKKEEKLQEQLQTNVTNVQNTVVSLESSIRNQLENTESLQNRVNQLLAKYQFNSQDAVRSAYIKEKQLEKLEEEVAEYNKKMQSIVTLIQSAHTKLNGRWIEETEWLKLNEKKEKLLIITDELLKNKIGKEKELAMMKQNLIQVEQLTKELKTLKLRQHRLDELNKLMRGNSFIEFISFGQLQYVAKEASNRLIKITNGKYSLLLDEETRKFTIRDHTSGGYTRSTDSLSGGELFLTSLSLALALSSHIQLKNAAPLEFFFLDEGFGTLDEHILDTAMSSLEKLHSDKMSVGIISHVKEIQERIPVKLEVKPAFSGEGSKVRLSYS